MRGEGGDWIVLDEADFVDKEVIIFDILPLFIRENTIVVMMSTQGRKSDSAFSRMIGMEHLLRCPFTVLRYNLICARCGERGLTKCPHREHYRPPWIDAEQIDKVMSIGRHLGEESGLMMELSNTNLESEWKAAFNDHVLKTMYVKLCHARMGGYPDRFHRAVGGMMRNVHGISVVQPVDFREQPRVIITAVDPAAGGKDSYTAFVSCVFVTVKDSVWSYMKFSFT